MSWHHRTLVDQEKRALKKYGGFIYDIHKSFTGHSSSNKMLLIEMKAPYTMDHVHLIV